jgi:hypothetical protein
MRHIDDGTLRRLQDEPLIVTETQRDHLASCERCRARSEAIGRDAAGTAVLMGAPAFDAAPALTRLHARIERDRLQPVYTRRTAPATARSRIRAWMAGPVAAVALAGALAWTPAGSLAQSFITIFQPQQVAPLYVTTGELTSLPRLREYGTVQIPPSVGATKVADAAAASQATGMHVLVPGTLPASVPSQATYDTMGSATGSFTFSKARAEQTAARLGKTLPTMPADVNGSTLRITSGAATVTTYGPTRGIPSLVIGQMVAPRVTSNGATVKQIEDYVLSLPGVSKQLADSIRALGDPTHTLPIPIPVDRAHAQQVKVDGVQGLAIGDSTGAGSAVVWEKGGIIYGVGGPLTENQVLDVANSLH